MARNDGTTAIPSRTDSSDALTPRERECLELVYQHMGSKEIARALNISAHTVDGHIRSAIRKLGVATRREAARTVMHAAPPQPLSAQLPSISSAGIDLPDLELPGTTNTTSSPETWVLRDVASAPVFPGATSVVPIPGKQQSSGGISDDLKPISLMTRVMRIAVFIMIAAILAITVFEALDRVVFDFLKSHH